MSDRFGRAGPNGAIRRDRVAVEEAIRRRAIVKRGYGFVIGLATLAGLAVGMMFGACALAAGTPSIRIAVIAPQSAIDGRSITQAAELATSQINTAGGIEGKQIKLIRLDDHASATDGVRAFQRAVKQDHAVAVVGNFISEVALAEEPWAARFKEPYIITGAWTTKINARIRQHYNRYKYVFRTTYNSNTGAREVCNYAHAILARKLGYKTAVVMSEDAAWTKPLDKEYLKCLPAAGVKVIDHIRFDPSTNDFRPIFSRIQKDNPDVIITGIAHVGVKPTVQWHNEQVPYLMAGWSSQAGASSFWKDTNGATEGVVTGDVAAASASITSKTIPFAKAYTKRFGETPAYDSYSTYDAMYILKAAIERAGSTRAGALVSALEKTNYVGTQGREVFQGRHAKFVHGLKYGKHYVPGVAIQWQHGKQVVIWPPKAADGHVQLPSFVKGAQSG